MQALNLEFYGMDNLSIEENMTIAGGHDGVVYQAGHALGQVVKFVGTVGAVVVLFFMPKS